MSRFVYSTFVPSIESTEMRSSPSRVASAVLPSGEIATWLTPDFSSPSASVPAGETVFPSIVKIEMEPPLRLATSASVPWRLMETPEGPLPASSVAITAGGFARRSMTDTRLSASVFVGSAGGVFLGGGKRGGGLAGGVGGVKGGAAQPPG